MNEKQAENFLYVACCTCVTFGIILLCILLSSCSAAAEPTGPEIPIYDVSEGGAVMNQVDAGSCSLSCWYNGFKLNDCVWECSP